MRQPSLLAVGLAVVGAFNVHAAAQTTVAATADSSFIVRFDVATGRAVDHLVAFGMSPLSFPSDLTIGFDGALYVASENNDQVLRYAVPSGQPSEQPFVAPGAGDLDAPSAILFVGDRLLVASSVGGANGKIRAFDLDGSPLGTLVDTGEGFLTQPTYMALGPGGDLFVLDNGADAILRFDVETGTPIGDGVYLGTGQGNLLEFAFGPDGDILVVSFGAGVRRFDGTTLELESTFGPGDASSIAFVDDSGTTRLFVLRFNDGRIDVHDAEENFFVENRVPAFEGNLSGARRLIVLPDPLECRSDVTDNGTVDFEDVLRVLADWGDCP